MNHAWKAAEDPKTGRTYYYNLDTKVSTWDRPMELMSSEERAEAEHEKSVALDFFRDMEKNIKNKFEDNFVPTLQRSNSAWFDEPTYSPGRRIRTISIIDKEITSYLKHQSGRCETKDDDHVSPRSRANSASISHTLRPSHSSEQALNYRFLDEVHSKELPDRKEHFKLKAKDDENLDLDKPFVERRNSTNTMFVDSTMTLQDDISTIHCVAVVIRAHMVEATEQDIGTDIMPKEFDVFIDNEYMGVSPTTRLRNYTVPSVDEISTYFRQLFKKSQLEGECIIISLIYCERLVKETRGHLQIRYDNWKTIIFASLVMASKVWDDLSMWNVDFSNISPSYNLDRVNALELKMLDILRFVIKVPASEYAKYYFHLRAMMSRLGMIKDLNHDIPLDWNAAKRLHLASESIESSQDRKDERRRTKSIHGAGGENSGGAGRSQDQGQAYTCLAVESLMHENHTDADGVCRTSRKIHK